MGVHWKIQCFFMGRKGGVHEKTIFGGRGGAESPKKGVWIVCRFKRGLGKKEKNKGVMFLRGGLETPMHTMLEEPSYWNKYPKQITLYTVLLLIILTIIVSQKYEQKK